MEKLEFKGTKGEWVTEYINATTQIRSDNKRLICEVYHLFEVYNDDEDEHNAKLIAAAPLILEALQEMVKQNELRGYGNSEDSIKAKQAIEKALK